MTPTNTNPMNQMMNPMMGEYGVHNEGKMMNGNKSTMTLADMQETFQEDLKDEIEDCNKYLDMAMAAEEMGQMELAHGLCEIAKDEYTHAEFLHKHLKHYGVEMPEMDRANYKKMKERVKSVFHR